MSINPVQYRRYIPESPRGEDEKRREPSSITAKPEEKSYDWEKWKEEKETDLKNLIRSLEQMKKASDKKLGISDAKPKDKSGQLTRRLVSADGQLSVRQVVAEAGSEMISLRMIAALGKGEDAARARLYIRKLERVISRAGRKLRELDEEDIVKVQKAKAERKLQQERAERLKTELRKKQMSRRLREHGYLMERNPDIIAGSHGRSEFGNPFQKLDAAEEAKIALQAEAQAAVELASPGGDTAVTAEGMAETAGSAETADIPSGEAAAGE